MDRKRKSGPRMDRLITSLLYYPLVLRNNLARTAKVPILMYHGITDKNGVRPMHDYYATNTPANVFRSQMQFLLDNGYRGAGLDEIRRFVSRTFDPGKKSVVLTFDDGLKDFLAEACPVLKRYGFTATVFVPAGFIGKKGTQNDRHLSWEELRDLSDNGFTVGSHSITHRRLDLVDRASLRVEIADSKKIIEDNIGREVTFFSYPFAYPENNKEFTATAKRFLEESGYVCGVTTLIGTTLPGDDPFCLRRIPVNGKDDLFFLRAKIEGAYDWLRLPQYLYKRFLKPKANICNRSYLTGSILNGTSEESDEKR